MLEENYPELEYCVQYDETDYNFALRLMEQFGISFYFDHSNDSDDEESVCPYIGFQKQLQSLDIKKL